MTQNVGTLNYRAPEIFFGATHYGPAIDIWSIGCIMGELILKFGNLFFNAIDELSLLKSIFKICGTPSEENWTGVSSLPKYIEFEDIESANLNEIFPFTDSKYLDLMS